MPHARVTACGRKEYESCGNSYYFLFHVFPFCPIENFFLTFYIEKSRNSHTRVHKNCVPRENPAFVFLLICYLLSRILSTLTSLTLSTNT